MLGTSKKHVLPKWWFGGDLLMYFGQNHQQKHIQTLVFPIFTKVIMVHLDHRSSTLWPLMRQRLATNNGCQSWLPIMATSCKMPRMPIRAAVRLPLHSQNQSHGRCQQLQLQQVPHHPVSHCNLLQQEIEWICPLLQWSFPLPRKCRRYLHHSVPNGPWKWLK